MTATSLSPDAWRLAPHEREALMQWALRHPARMRTPWLTEAEQQRCAFCRHLREAGRLES